MKNYKQIRGEQKKLGKYRKQVWGEQNNNEKLRQRTENAMFICIMKLKDEQQNN